MDNKIKEKCEEFISFTYEYLTMELKSFVLASKWPSLVKKEEGAVENSTDSNQTQSPVEQCKLKLKEALQAYQNKKARIQKSMSLYLANPETEAIIFKQVKVSPFISCAFESITSSLLLYSYRPKFNFYTNS